MASSSGEGVTTDEPFSRRLLLTVQDVVGKRVEGPPFWSPQISKGFVEVRFGKSRTKKVSTATKDVEDFELSFNEQLAMDMDHSCQELVVSVCAGEVGKPGPVLARCGIYVDQIVGTEPVNKYFNLYKMAPDGTYERGGFIRVTVCWEPEEEDEEEVSMEGTDFTDLDVPVSAPELDRASMVVMDDGDSRSSLSADDVTPSWLNIPVVYKGPMPMSAAGSSGDLQWGQWAVAGSDENASSRGELSSSLACTPPAARTPSGYMFDDDEVGSEVDGQGGGQSSGGGTSRAERGDLGSIDSPQALSRDMRLEILSPPFSSDSGMPRLNLTVMPREHLGGQASASRGTGSARGDKASPASELAEDLSTMSLQQRHPAVEQSPEGVHPLHQGSDACASDCGGSDAPTEYSVVGRCRGGVSPWLLFTLTAVGGAAAVALKVLGPGGSRCRASNASSPRASTQPASEDRDEGTVDSDS
ncbi:unnamed protein product [Ostreobium quekettii]|uniref:C2 domain-containing protein n=1 Tax=Ostreobium quekettii TaxID=121088 RepID=A0A8S1IYW0_9CHLO|nr:unnamed protein product [Ostreobium quekettii]